MKYLIENITFKNGEPKTDPKSIRRIGCVVEFTSELLVGEPLYFDYHIYNNGKEVDSHLTRTSIIDDFDCFSYPGKLLVFTKNSIYTFKILGDEEEHNE